MGFLHQALSKVPYSVGRWEMSAKTWNNLKTRVMAVHGPNIDWWGVRIAVNRYLTERRNPNDSAVDAFNTIYEFTPLPYRENNPDGSPSTGAMVEYAAILIVASVLILSVYALFVFGIMIMTALVLGG